MTIPCKLKTCIRVSLRVFIIITTVCALVIMGILSDNPSIDLVWVLIMGASLAMHHLDRTINVKLN